MNRGAYWAGTPLQSDADEADRATDSAAYAGITDFGDHETPLEPPSATLTEKALLGLLGLVALGWLAAMIELGIEAFQAGTLNPSDIMRGISVASGPLVLIVTLLILWQRNSARESQRYADVARTVRMETLALDAVLNLTSRRLAEDRAAVAEQADALLALADETSTRLRGVTDALARQITELGRQSRDLDEAAGTARVDMGVLLADLPIAEAQTRALADIIRTAGAGAHEQAAALDATLLALSARARDAEDGTATAANRLSAQVSRIAGASEVATRGIDEAGQRMTGSIDGVLARAADAVEQTRKGVAAQSDAIDAMIERAQASAEAASAHAAQVLEDRVGSLAAEVEAIAAKLAAQDGVGAALVERIQRGLAGVEARFAELDETGRIRTEKLGEALGTLGTHAERTMAALNDGGVAATTLINRAETLKAAIHACLVELGEDLPTALAKLETEAARSRETIAASGPELTHLAATAAQAAEALDTARIALDSRRGAIEALTDDIATRMAVAKADAASLGETVQEADAKAIKLADSTSPKLVDALIRVRETAGQAAERAREALSSIIPGSAAALGAAGRKALETAISGEVESQIARVAAASESAVEAARAAAVRLEEQLSRVVTTSASVEDHIAEGRAIVEAKDRDNFSQRVSLLIDSLNSTAIDVTKLLSNEASDSAWAAYLRGDRGVFTRRAVRLIENGEAREITRHYEDEPEFREQVNRYIHDFEALLRPILATREGSTLAVIMLSSEMGKLYVALAQAIERLRS
jgi:hypothetical protein